MTNADRIRIMTNEELAEFILEVKRTSECMTGEKPCIWEDYPAHDKGCKDCFLAWLKKEEQMRGKHTLQENDQKSLY